MKSLLGADGADECCHRQLDSVELVRQVPSDFIGNWLEKRQLGWQGFHRVLRYAQEERTPKPSGVSNARDPRAAVRDDELVL